MKYGYPEQQTLDWVLRRNCAVPIAVLTSFNRGISPLSSSIGLMEKQGELCSKLRKPLAI